MRPAEFRPITDAEAAVVRALLERCATTRSREASLAWVGQGGLPIAHHYRDAGETAVDVVALLERWGHEVAGRVRVAVAAAWTDPS